MFVTKLIRTEVTLCGHNVTSI